MDLVLGFKLFVDLVLGVLSVPFIEFIKKQVGWSEGKALLLALGVAAALGAIELAIAGYFKVESFTFDQLFYTVSAVFAAAQLYYRKLQFGVEDEEGAVG
jgi:hypothetical protein